MTYNEWRDELKKNLLNVSEREKQRVLDYYAEAYADRREAGLSERQVIEDFGAPYDAAQRILLNFYDNSDEEPCRDRFESERDYSDRESKKKHFCRAEKERSAPVVEAEIVRDDKRNKTTRGQNNGWIFVLLCVIFAIPLLVLFVTFASISFALIISPFALLVAGIGTIGLGCVELFSSVASGLLTIGEGLIAFGIGLVLMPLLVKLVKITWQLLKRFFNWVSSLFSGKEYAK